VEFGGFRISLAFNIVEIYATTTMMMVVPIEMSRYCMLAEY
jgi:hypothetical protein